MRYVIRQSRINLSFFPMADYLNYFHLDKGYLLSFNFNQKKETGVKTITVGEKTIVEAVV